MKSVRKVQMIHGTAAVFLVLMTAGCVQEAPLRLEEQGDMEAPVLSCEDQLTWNDSRDLFRACTVSDNAADNLKITWFTQADGSTPGQYPVVFTAKDDAGNIAVHQAVITVPEKEKPAETQKPEESTDPASAEGTPVPVPEPSASPAPVTPAPETTPVPEKTADPYTADRQHCADTWGTWQGTYCVWPAPFPTPTIPDTSGGTTTCWDYKGEDGKIYHSCEWTGEWEEY